MLLGSELTDTTEVMFSIERARALVLTGDVHEAARAGAVAFELLDVMPPGDRGHAYVTLADVFVAVGDNERARGALRSRARPARRARQAAGDRGGSEVRRPARGRG